MCQVLEAPGREMVSRRTVMVELPSDAHTEIVVPLQSGVHPT